MQSEELQNEKRNSALVAVILHCSFCNLQFAICNQFSACPAPLREDFYSFGSEPRSRPSSANPHWESPVEPFPIICETCHARLKVRSASVVGEIHACPKCGSMIHIVPPVAWQEASRQTPAAQPDSPVAQPAADPAAPTLAFVEPPAQPMPAASGTQPLVLWGIVGALLLGVGGLAAALWRGGRDSAADPVPVAQAANEAIVVDPLSDEIDDATSTAPPAALRDPYAVDRSAIPANTTEELASHATLPELPVDEPEPATSENEPTPEKAAGAPQPQAASESPPSTPPTSEQPPRVAVLRFDPLDFDPSQLSLGSRPASPETPHTVSVADDPAADVAPVAAAIVDEAADEVPPPPAVNPTLAVRLGPMPSQASPRENGAAQLAFRVTSFDATGMPLARFIETVADMAGVPIALDAAELELAGVSPKHTVTVRANDITLEKLLGDVLMKQRLEIGEHNGHVRVTLANSDRRRGVDYELKDLIGDDDAQHLANLIQRFVAPATWPQPATGHDLAPDTPGSQVAIVVDGTKLHVEQTNRVHHQILIFCERLRLARGLPLRSRYPAKRLSVNPPHEQLAAKLNEATTFTFLPWTRLAEVVRHWQLASGLTILIDWSALADAELGPSSPVACSVIDRKWEESLDGILAPLGLAWWAVDGETIQITTREALDKIQRIEFYAVPPQLRDQFASGQALEELLESELRERADGQASTGQFRVELDKPSGRLIVLASPDVHRFLSQRFRGDAK